jgi:hypothetical protein
MIGVGFGAHQFAVGRNFELDVVANFGLKFAEDLDCFFDGSGDLGVSLVEEKLARDADAQSCR